MPKTDHTEDINRLRRMVSAMATKFNTEQKHDVLLLVADLLEIHDSTGLSLDDWPAAKAVLAHLGVTLQPNGV